MLAVASIGMVSKCGYLPTLQEIPEAFGIPLDWEHTIVAGLGGTLLIVKS
jgi:hypothetical protein